jgi:hypothetical protein
MKSTPFGFLMLLALAQACGGKAPDAKNPGKADETMTSDDVGGGGAPTGSKRARTQDPDESGPMKCGGFEIADLAAMLSQVSCEVPDAKADTKDRDVKDVLEVSIQTDPGKIAAGSTATVRVVLHNKGKTELPLDFVVDPEPRFDFELYTAKGKRADRPAGAEPSLPREVAEATAPDQKTARVTLAAQGTATLTRPWSAVKYKWASKEKARGALPGHGYPREPAGALPRGKYVIRVLLPLVGVFEGSDHEVSQPRTNIEIVSP